jgi:cyclohexanecarboxylate-CoA ligase
MPADLDNGRKLIGGRSIRWDEKRAASAYARGLWSRETLAEALHAAAEKTPQRVLLIDGNVRLDC